jgi:hypothetical protein
MSALGSITALTRGKKVLPFYDSVCVQAFAVEVFDFYIFTFLRQTAFTISALAKTSPKECSL